MEYQVVQGVMSCPADNGKARFLKDCNELLAQGWEPVGGVVFVDKVMGVQHCAQAFIRRPVKPSFWSRLKFWG